MDIFRFDAEGKILEHWDAIQEVPIEAKNGNMSTSGTTVQKHR